MIKTELNISMEDSHWKTTLPDVEKISHTVLETTFAYVEKHHNLNFLPDQKNILVSLCLSNDQTVQRLNKEFRNIDRPTNVLSFAALDDPDFAKDCKLFDEIELGDIIIALETTQKEAVEKNISFADHYCHLLTHGLLHILGFDHRQDDEAEYMESFETNILQALSIADPYRE